jgi:hypothetical protein
MSFPDMSGALWGLMEPMQFNVVTTTVVDGEAIETPSNQIVFDGVLQPLSPRLLWIKPEGERKWKWWTLFTAQDLDLDNILQDEQGLQYRVMKEWDWRSADFQEYEIIQAPFPAYAGS